MPDNPIKDAEPRSNNMFVTWHDEASMQAALTTMGNAVDNTHVIQRSRGGALRRFEGIDTNISVRDGFTRLDYEYFREDERTPKFKKEIIFACMKAYKKVGIIKNVIDLMGDFCSRGIKISHVDKQTELIYRRWFKMIKGKSRSSSFANLLYRCGQVFVKRNTAKLDESYSKLKRIVAKHDYKKIDTVELPPNEFPISYYFLNPLMVEILGDELSIFSNKMKLALKIPRNLKNKVTNPQNEFQSQMINGIPGDIREAIQNADIANTQNAIPFHDAKVSAYFYKKDDWEVLADPLIYCIFNNLVVYEKLQLADLAALDGAISRIRVWKIGSLEHKIMPTEQAIQKLNEILLAAPGNGSVIDLIYHPAIEFDETSTDVANFLGSEKYAPTMEAIYGGLGIPQTIRGHGGSTMTDNFVQIKTFVEKLQYGRDALTEHWETELEFVRKALKGIPGFDWKHRAHIDYDYINLTDDAAQNKLIMDLVDRDIISVEKAREDLGYNNEIEMERLDREWTSRKKRPKPGPYPDANPDLVLKKIFAQAGNITPSEVGIELDEKDSKQLSKLDVQIKQMQAKKAQQKSKIGQSGQGRPKNTPDTKPRKKRIPLVAQLTWATKSQTKINELLTPIIIEKYGKQNLRQLTTAQSTEFEKLKFMSLCNLPLMTEINEESIQSSLEKGFGQYNFINSVYNSYISQIEYPTLDDCRQAQILAYLSSHSEETE